MPLMSVFLVLVLSACDQNFFGFSLLHPYSDRAEAENTVESDVDLVVSDYASLLASLSTAGAEVSEGEIISQPFFTVTGKIIRVNGEDVQVFEYEDEAAAETDASQISEDGSSIGTSMISWMASPHFYRGGKLIVLYVGDNTEITSLLESLLGPQFAGR
jgi:hypothetical protein